MFNAQLKVALRQTGCPVCFLRQKAVARYMFTTLWENVNDSTFRQRFLGSEGLCKEHAWQLPEAEAGLWRDSLGVAILYESLLAATRRECRRELDSLARAAHPWWHPARWWRRSPQPAPLPPASCPVCDVGESTARFYARELAERFEENGWRDHYSRGDGLCWPHLRLALARAKPDSRRWLLEEVETRLTVMQQDLTEYIRKHAWQYQEEPMSEAERQAAARAIAVLRGPKDGPIDDEI